LQILRKAGPVRPAGDRRTAGVVRNRDEPLTELIARWSKAAARITATSDTPVRVLIAVSP
jgi:hypothetical protein